VGLVMIFVQVGLNINIWNINKGLIALICNAAVLIAVSLNTQPDEETKKNFALVQNYNPTIQA
jgi:hypothetical protein